MTESTTGARAQAPTIAPARMPADLHLVRNLFTEYADSLGIDLSFQGFEQELATLPGRYAPPDGRLLLARHGDQVLGCVGLRKLEDGICEMKRLYVRPAYRGLEIGRNLAQRVIEEARAAGYVRMWLDTLKSMSAARALYTSLGFSEILPYSQHPVEGTICMEKVLSAEC